MSGGTRPDVTALPPDGAVTAVALVLPGGKARSAEAFSPGQLTAVRMRPFAHDLHRHGRAHGLAVWSLEYRLRGWNDPALDPVADAHWALDEVRRRHGDVPVVLVGHSMGGRTSLRVAGDAAVRGVCALAPWVDRHDPVDQLAGRDVLVAHGTVDLVTSARQSRLYAERAAGTARRIGRVQVVGDTHAMLFRWGLWHSLATGFSLGVLGLAALPRRVERAFVDGAAGNFTRNV